MALHPLTLAVSFHLTTNQATQVSLSCVCLCVQVPWGAKETALGMFAWCAAFAGVGLAFVPAVIAVAGPKGFAGLSAADKAQFALLNQVIETAVSIGIIRLGVAKFAPLPPGLFKYDFRCVGACRCGCGSRAMPT